MMDAATIRHMSDQAAMRVAFERELPVYVPYGSMRPPFPIPFLGNAVDKYNLPYEIVIEFFVDSSGWGQPGEPAMTIDEFCRAAEDLIDETDEPLYWGITTAGQFQVYVAAYRKTNELGDDEIADLMPGEDAFYFCGSCQELHEIETDSPAAYSLDEGDICEDCWNWGGEKHDTFIVGDEDGLHVEVEVFEKYGLFTVETWAYGTGEGALNITDGEGDLGVFDDPDEAMDAGVDRATEWLVSRTTKEA